MRPCRACEEMHHFNPSVRSSSSDHDQSDGPPIASNLNCYNSIDGGLQLKSI